MVVVFSEHFGFSLREKIRILVLRGGPKFFGFAIFVVGISRGVYVKIYVILLLTFVVRVFFGNVLRIFFGVSVK